MGRRRQNSDLPTRMYHKHGAYYHVSRGTPQKWTRLGADYQEALRRYADLEGAAIGTEYTDGWRKKMFERARSGARARKVPFNLSREDLEALIERSGHRCAVTGLKFEAPEKGTISPWAPSLDRIDSNLGYSFENCRLVCLSVNYALNKWGTDVLLTIADALRAKAVPNCRRVYKESPIEEVEDA